MHAYSVCPFGKRPQIKSNHLQKSYAEARNDWGGFAEAAAKHE